MGSHGNFRVGTNLLEGVIGPSPCHEFVRLLGANSNLHILTELLVVGRGRHWLTPAVSLALSLFFQGSGVRLGPENIRQLVSSWVSLAFLGTYLPSTCTIQIAVFRCRLEHTHLRMLGTIRPASITLMVPRTNRPTKRRSPSRQPRSRQIDKYCLLYTNCRSHVSLSSTTHLRIQPRKIGPT